MKSPLLARKGKEGGEGMGKVGSGASARGSELRWCVRALVRASACACVRARARVCVRACAGGRALTRAARMRTCSASAKSESWRTCLEGGGGERRGVAGGGGGWRGVANSDGEGA